MQPKRLPSRAATCYHPTPGLLLSCNRPSNQPSNQPTASQRSHEYFANEDFEKGITCYRNAIRIDPRHYNAWCAGARLPACPLQVYQAARVLA